jgi:hypothetical protein
MAKDRISAYADSIRAKLSELDSEKLEEVDITLDLDYELWFKMQQYQSSAFASGKISQSDSQIAYAALGEVMNDKNGGWQPGTDTALKFTITKMFEELLSARIG